MSVGLLVTLVCLLGSSLVGANPIEQDQKAEVKKYLNEKLDNSELEDEETTYDLFEEWATAHDLSFKDDNERMDALLKWKKNALKIKTHRKEYKEGRHTYQIGLNKFAHMTVEELKQKRLGFKNLNPTRSKMAAEEAKVKGKKVKRATTLPTSVDWVSGGLVTSVKDQGNCGSCWTFSAAAVLEGAYAKMSGLRKNVSEEEFVDCAAPYIGCDGGVPATAVDFVKAQGGVATLESYPYIAQDEVYNPLCIVASAIKIPMTPTYTWLDTDQDILAALAVQPISAAIAVGGDTFYYYESGVMDPATACDPPDQVNHAVAPVGYGVDPVTNIPYWKIKNSWAADWGEQGYFRIRRDIPNSCGITVEAIKVTL
jgi:C1A family cysteine protease